MKYSFKERYLLYGGSVIGSLFLIISYIPQIYLTIKTGDVSGQSLGFWTVLVIAILHMLLNQYGLYKYGSVKNRGGIYVQIINLILSSTMLILLLLFR